jgi:hypothetical protein
VFGKGGAKRSSPLFSTPLAVIWIMYIITGYLAPWVYQLQELTADVSQFWNITNARKIQMATTSSASNCQIKNFIK